MPIGSRNRRSAGSKTRKPAGSDRFQTHDGRQWSSCFYDSFGAMPRRPLFDIDDTEGRIHGGQQLTLFNAHYDSRCFPAIHICEAITGKPGAIIPSPR
jgi:hypothetical protein